MAYWNLISDDYNLGLGRSAEETLKAYSEHVLEMSRGKELEKQLPHIWDVRMDYTLLSAAEIATSLSEGVFESNWNSDGIEVQGWAVEMAIAKADCGPHDFHDIRKTSLDDVPLWEVVVFAGDMVKLAALGYPSSSKLYEGAEDAIQSLVDHKAASPLFGHEYESLHSLSVVLGGIWLSKAALVGGISDSEGETRMGAYRQGLGYH